MRIGLSQPAASHALQRLRDLIADPLQVRARGADAAGARLVFCLGATLEQVRGLFASDAFDAARSERQFRLVMPDLAVELLMPPLMALRSSHSASASTLCRGRPAIFTPEFARTIDLVISLGSAFNGFHRQLLYTDSDALAVRRGHPLGARLKKKEVFLDAQHVAVTKRGRDAELIDRWLRPMGIERKIVLVVPGHFEAVHVAVRTSLVAFVPRCLICGTHKAIVADAAQGSRQYISPSGQADRRTAA